jgi:hypothetical protein
MFRRHLIGLCLAASWLGSSLKATADEPKKESDPQAQPAKVLRVLLFAGAPTRDYQFLRSFVVREIERNRAQVSICLQPPSESARKPGIIQDVDPKRMLDQFPDRYQAKDTEAEERARDLANYDVIVAFDPDWTALKPEQQAILTKWVEQGGGLIVVAGPVNTMNLVRPATAKKVQGIADLYPVVLDDVRLVELKLPNDKPKKLNFPKTRFEYKFLKLDPDGKGRFAGWQEFFTGLKDPEKAQDSTAVVRGFYSYYPVKNVKAGAVVLATLDEPAAKMGDGEEQPFLVSRVVKKGSVLYISSGETWRLRQHNPAFHERFWSELLREVSNSGGEVKP